jgi:hypothetical protein
MTAPREVNLLTPEGAMIMDIVPDWVPGDIGEWAASYPDMHWDQRDHDWFLAAQWVGGIGGGWAILYEADPRLEDDYGKKGYVKAMPRVYVWHRANDVTGDAIKEWFDSMHEDLLAHYDNRDQRKSDTAETAADAKGHARRNGDDV